MRGRTKLLVGGMVALGALAVAGPAFAQDAPPTVEEQLTTRQVYEIENQVTEALRKNFSGVTHVALRHEPRGTPPEPHA